MATTYHNQLQQLYVAYFNRPADPGGLAHYEGVLETAFTNGGATAVTSMMGLISADFARSAEYRTAYNDATNTGIVTKVYANLFGRVGTANEMKFWIDALNAGKTTIDKVVTDIAAGAQTTDKVAFESKVVFATAFTNAVNTDVEIAAYANTAALNAAKALVTGIKTATQATDAVATIDTHVAAVVKAGTPFSLESGLAALNAATTARADFFTAFDDAQDGAGDIDADGDVDADDIAEYVDAAQVTLNGLVANPLYANPATSEGVKAALLADQIETNADALVEQNKQLTTARAAVEKVTGLNARIAEYNSAVEASDDADAAAIEAASVFSGARTTLIGRYTTSNSLTVNATTGEVSATVSGSAKALTTVNTDGTIKVASGVTAADWNGLAALVTAFNASKAATADAADATLGERYAQLAVEVQDVSSTADPLDADGASTLAAIPFASGQVTVKTAGKPTFNELMDEMSALAATGSPAQQTAFNNAINTFLSTNTSPLATKVAEEVEDVEEAQEAIDALQQAISDLQDAEELAVELESLDDAVVAAQTEFTTNKFVAPKMLDGNRFGTSGSDIFVADGKDATITSFGRVGDDVLYIGSGFKLNASGDLEDGVNADLEVFFVKSGNSTIVTVETKAYGSETGDVFEITLTGVNADDLTFSNGIISM